MKTKSVIFIDVNSEEASLIIDACQHTLADIKPDLWGPSHTEDVALYIRDALLNGRRRLELSNFESYKLLNVLAYYKSNGLLPNADKAFIERLDSVLDTLRDEVTFDG